MSWVTSTWKERKEKEKQRKNKEGRYDMGNSIFERKKERKENKQIKKEDRK